MSYALLDAAGLPVATVPTGLAVVVGRSAGCEVPLLDPTVSRRHAELRATDGTLVVRDLGSRNGTFRNGVRVEAARLRDGDVVAFGTVALRVGELGAAGDPEHTRPGPAPIAAAAAPLPPAPAPRAPAALPPVVPPPAPAPAPPPAAADAGDSAGDAGEAAPIVAERATRAAGDALDPGELTARTLALLLDVGKGLGRAGDGRALLERIVGYAFQTLPAADRVALLLADERGALAPAVARDRWRADLVAAGVAAVPRSIVRDAAERRAALLTVDATEDPRFAGGLSVVRQRVRSAMCAPLLGGEAADPDGARVLGVLYVDSGSATDRFSAADLDVLAAFAGIAAAALENARLAERVRQEAVARGNFERYFAPQLAARIAASSEPARPGGERRTVAVLFGDLRGFTRFAASVPPDAVAATLSEYLSAMVECVFRHGGTLDKFIGDAVMAQWGAPEAHPDDADRAMRAALDMLEALEALNARWRAEGRAALQMGVGLSYGDVFAGNIGSERRLEFTVIGEAVNEASRLCDAAAPGEILLADGLRRALRSAPRLRQLPTPHLPGQPPAPAVFAVERGG